MGTDNAGLATREAIILAGGLGTRLRGMIGDLPKPMAPVAGRPFLAWQMDSLARRGVREIVLSVGYRREVVEAHFGEQHGDMAVRYARETSPLGTGGAIVEAMKLVHGPAVFVLNGDTFIRSPLLELESARDCDMAMLVARVEDASRFGTVVVTDGRVTGFREKAAGGPGLVNSGVYWIPRELLQGMEPGTRFSFEKDFMEREASRLRIAAVVTGEPFIDIGIPETLAESGRVIPELASRD